MLTLRYGMTKFVDDDTLSIDFDPASLGFSSNFLGQTTVDKFPQVRVTEYDDMGAIDPTPRNWYSWSANGTYTRLAGKHTLKFGGDYRLIGIETQSFGGSAGFFYFDRYFTSSNPNSNGTGGTTPSGNALASLLLGYPTSPGSDNSRASYLNQTSPFNAYVHYFGGYAQDDWRLQPEDDASTSACASSAKPGWRKRTTASPSHSTATSTRAARSVTSSTRSPVSRSAAAWCMPA